jgi:hypothetical protein
MIELVHPTGQTSRPWRIHELAQEFRRKDVWALPTHLIVAFGDFAALPIF